jgi:prepilin-type processing-associated H-X9-DG protein
MQCTNHIKQIALAMHTYHDVHDELMIGSRHSNGIVWIHFIPAFIEQTSLASRIDTAGGRNYNFADAARGIDNRVPFLPGNRIGILNCPSDRPGATVPEGESATFRGQSLYNYLVSAGNTALFDVNGSANTVASPGFLVRTFHRPSIDTVDEILGGALYMAQHSAGTPSTGAPQTFGSVSDGLSNVVMISELLIGPSGSAASVNQDTRGMFMRGYNIPYFTTFLTPNSVEPDKPYAALGASRCVNDPERGLPCLFATWAIRGHGVTATADVGYLAARSRHTGGANAARADGSVHFFSSSISQPIWRALGTTQSGRPR